MIGRLRPGAEATFTYRLPTRKRGIYDVGPLLLKRQDPFGLLSASREVSDTATLWVHPRHHALLPLPASLDRSLDGPTSDSTPRGSITFHSLREYVLGDDLRHIHWRSSARLGTLMVRQHVDTTLPDVAVVIDTRPEAHSADSFEAAVEAAASVIFALLSQRFPVKVTTTASTLLDPHGSHDPLTGFLDTLAGLELEPGGSYATTTDRLSRRRGGFAAVVLSGGLTPSDLQAISPLQHVFGHLVVANLRPDVMPIVGALGKARVIDAPTSESFANQWNQRRSR